LARLGVEDELVRLGAVPGCSVLIGPVDDSVVFDWQPSALLAGDDHEPAGEDTEIVDELGSDQ